MSLTARLQIACAAQILGHHALWKRIFDSVGLPLGEVLSKVFLKRIMTKQNDIYLEELNNIKRPEKLGGQKSLKYCVENK